MSENKIDNETIRAIGLAVLLGVGGFILYDHFAKEEKAVSQKQISLQDSSPAALSPYGKLPDVFNLMSDYTDLQRENLAKEIIGKVVNWILPIYEIKKISNDKYRVSINAGKNVGCVLEISNPNEWAIDILNSLKTGDYVEFKGYINKITADRKLFISPAQILNGPITNIKQATFVFNSCIDEENIRCLQGKINSQEMCLFAGENYDNYCHLLKKNGRYRIFYYKDEVMPGEEGYGIAGIN